jgi:hypothetical protein
MTNLEHIKELTAGECPDWVCEQIAESLDQRDATIKALRREFADENFRANQLELAFDKAKEQLVASQAREQQLREVLVALLSLTTGDTYNIIRKTLILPTDDTALRQYGAKLLKDAKNVFTTYGRYTASHIHLLLNHTADKLEQKK